MNNLSHFNSNRIALLISGLFLLICFGFAIYFPGTGDSGDSIEHFLFAKYAFKHPENFLNHWAKPLFVLTAAAFVQLGFVGVKIFNSLLAVLTGFFTFLVAKKLGMKRPALAIILLFFSPLYFTLIFSGLTEYLFALMLVVSIYLILREKLFLAIILVSFLPFVRSEGLVLIGVFLVYLLVERRLKLIPILAFGHVCLSVVGAFHYGSLLWVFNKIPYAHLSSDYGSGQYFHFANKLVFIFGIPVLVLLLFGLMASVINFKKLQQKSIWIVLIAGSFIAFFIAHTLFWSLGIFNSAGLPRVFIAVVPLGVLLACNGINFLFDIGMKVQPIFGKILFYGMIIYVLIFPFTSNHAAIDWNHDFGLTPDQKLVDNLKPFVQDQLVGVVVYHGWPYINYSWGIDPYDIEEHKSLGYLRKEGTLDENALVVWDNWFAPVQHHFTKQQLENDPRLKKLKSIRAETGEEVVIFQVLSSEN